MKKDYEEIEELDDEIVDDEIIDDEVVEEIEDEPKASKKTPKKVSNDKVKKGMKKGTKVAIISSSVGVGVIAIVLVALFVVLPLFGISIFGKYKVPKVTEELYYDATSPVGLYFYGENHTILNGQKTDKADMVRAKKGLSKSYFDPSKPTIIWTHGWEDQTKGSFGDRYLCAGKDTREAVSSYDQNYAYELKKQGYNVATLQYQNVTDDGENYAKDLAYLFKFCVEDFNGTGKSLSFMFASEIADILGEEYDQELTLVGHSCGGFMVTATAYMLQAFYVNGKITNKNLVPGRLILEDPYVNTLGDVSPTKIYGTNEKINKRSKCQIVQNMISSLDANSEVAIEVFLGMTMASSKFVYDEKGDFTKVKPHCVTVDMTGLKAWQGNIGKVHVVTRDWVWASMVYGKIKTTDGNIAPTAALTKEEIRSLHGKLYQQNYKGFSWKKTPLPEVIEEVSDTSGFRA